MKLLNVGCGSTRAGDPWVNLDELHSILKPGTPERTNLDKEQNYVDHKLPEIMPFKEGTFDGCLISHVIEHFDCQDAVRILEDCRRILKIGGLLLVSVPDAEYFLSVYDQDTPEKAVELFGEPICPDEPWHKSFFDYALFYKQHKQVLTEGSTSCLMIKAGFGNVFNLPQVKWLNLVSIKTVESPNMTVLNVIEKLMNRRKFSLEVTAVK